MPILLRIFLFTFIPIIAMILGGGIAVFRTPGPRLGSAIQHFAAGMVFSAVAVELLPEVISKHAPVATIVGFGLGIALMLLIREGMQRFEKSRQGKSESPTGLIVVTGVDITIDGLLIGIGFVAGAQQGVLLTIALTLELLSLGLSSVVALNQGGIARRRSFVMVVGLAFLPLIGALAGGTALKSLSGDSLDAVLSFGIAALLYLVTEELLVEAHETPETPATTAMFFLGFLLLLIITMFVS